MDFGIVFLSDVHIGSLTFLEDAFSKFIDWINCEYGDEKQRRVAEDVKYLINRWRYCRWYWCISKSG